MGRIDAAVDLTEDKEIEVLIIDPFGSLHHFEEKSGKRCKKQECAYRTQNDLPKKDSVKRQDAVLQDLLIGYTQAQHREKKQADGKSRVFYRRFFVFTLRSQKINQFISGYGKSTRSNDNQKNHTKIDQCFDKCTGRKNELVSSHVGLENFGSKNGEPL